MDDENKGNITAHTSITNALDALVERLTTEYHHMLGVNRPTDISTEDIVHYIADYYQSIIDCMPGNVYWLDKNCVAVGCNKNVLNMFGFTSVQEYKGLTFEAMGSIGQWSEQAIESFKRDTIAVIQSGRAKLNVEEPPIPNCDGKIIYFLSSRVPLWGHHNKVIGVVGISINITELKETQDALTKAKEKAEIANQLKNEFIANMSHDVKTPIIGIVGMAENLMTVEQGLSPQAIEFMKKIMSSSQKVLSFFDDCLTLSKIDVSKLSFPNESFNLQKMLEDLIVLIQPMIESKKLTLEVFCENPERMYVYGARTALYRVLLNLISNAIKFTPAGFIRIVLRVSDNTNPKRPVFDVAITDSGIGISKEKQSIIFERFARVASAYEGTYEGHGIGLSVAQQFIEAMHGRIDVESNLGKGSTFTVRVPLDIALLGPETQAISVQSNGVQDEFDTTLTIGSKILVVEDDEIAQRVQQLLFSSLGCEVDVAGSGRAAIQLFREKHYDLVFSDMGLPDINGREVARNIREIEKIQHNTISRVPIIGLSAHTNEESAMEYLLGGDIDVLINKPLLRQQAQALMSQHITKA